GFTLAITLWTVVEWVSLMELLRFYAERYLNLVGTIQKLETGVAIGRKVQFESDGNATT
ncbi:MAG: hypothetical protein QOE82_1615, partial [Thermoanaerobaculia bacterium]|nr:hypothetical protein [Thermoanaerobaculia bacterium]